VADGAARPLGRLAGNGDDADDLLGAESGRAAQARRVGENPLDQAEEVSLGRLLLLGPPQGVGGPEPAVAPEADADAGEAQLVGGGVDTGISGQGQEDLGAADQTLGGRLALGETLEQGLLQGRDGDGGCCWSGHGSAP